MSGSAPHIKSIFGQALEFKSPADRDRYVAEACGDDSELRAEVEALLRSLENARGFLASPASEAPSTLQRPAFPETGSVIGPYKLLQQIGEGGCGVVFMAEQTEPVRRKVALKLIKPGMDTRQVIARFEAERQALALMDHPNIAKVLDAGTTDESSRHTPCAEAGDGTRSVPTTLGRPYFVMELVHGVPITQYCDDRRLTLRQRLELFIPVCQAVQHAHQKGIIHRDLKPTNVLVADYDERPVAKIIDFGVAKATGQQLTEKTMFTQFGQVVGTIEYMSPEQAKLNQLDIDTRTDVYSLGVLLYELLAGETPFDKQRLRLAALDEMLRIIREDEPPKPSTRLTQSETLPSIAANRHLEPHKLTALVRGELDWIVMKCLEKDRNRRYETASGFAADIERYLHDEPVQACPPSAAYRFRKFARRNTAALTTASLVCVVLVLGTLISTWQAVRATRALEAESAARRDADVARGQAKAEAQKAKTEAAIAQAVNDFLNHDLLAQANDNVAHDRYNVLGVELKLLTVLNRAGERIEGQFPDQPLVEAALRDTIGITYRSFGENHSNWRRAAKHLERAVELRRAHLGEEHPDTLTSMAGLATVREDVDLCDRVLQARRRVLGQDHPATLASMFSLAYVLDRRGEKARALDIFRELLEKRRRVLGEDHFSTAWTKHLVACVQRNLDGNVGPEGAHGAEIERLYREALATMLKKQGDASWDAFDVTLRLGQFLNAPGHYDRAEAVFQEGYVRLQSQAAPPEWSAALASELNAVYRNWNKPERAAEWERKRIAANEATLSRNVLLLRDFPDDADLLASTATLLFQLGRVGEAESAYRLAIAVNADDPWLHQLFGDACASQGRFAEAEAAFREAIRLEPNEGGRHHNLADALRNQGKFFDAAAEYAEAIRLRPNEHASHYGLGSVYAFGGHWHKAAPSFERAAELSPADFWSLYRWATLCFYNNDSEGYRRACRAMLDHFGETNNVQVADCTVKACSLGSDFAGDVKQVMELADLTVAGTEEDPARKWFEITKGLVDYRAGRFGPAAEMIVRSAPSGDGSHRDALAFSILSMAQHRLANVDDAHMALASAQRIMSTKMPKTEKGETFGDDWHDWLHAQILCREAEKLLKTAPAGADSQLESVEAPAASAKEDQRPDAQDQPNDDAGK